jgi:hypothetical protein
MQRTHARSAGGFSHRHGALFNYHWRMALGMGHVFILKQETRKALAGE